MTAEVATPEPETPAARALQEHLERVREKSKGYRPPPAAIPESERPPALPPNPETDEFRRRYGSGA